MTERSLISYLSSDITSITDPTLPITPNFNIFTFHIDIYMVLTTCTTISMASNFDVLHFIYIYIYIYI